MARKSVVLLFLLLFSLLASGCSTKYADMTTHKSANFVLNEDGTYTMEKNLLYFRDSPDTVIIPEIYSGKPVTSMSGNYSDFSIIDVIGSKNLERIENNTFAYFSDGSHMNLERVIFPKTSNLKSIGRDSFFNCDHMELFVVPENFESFGIGCFYACNNLSSLVIYSETPPSGSSGLFADWRNPGFYNIPEVKFTVYVPDNALEVYKQSEWGERNLKGISEIESSYVRVFEDIENSKLEEQKNKENLERGLLISALFAGLFIICFFVYLCVHSRKSKIVLNNSTKIKELLELNKLFSFKKVQSRYSSHKECTSKRQLDNLSMEKVLVSLIKSDPAFYREILVAIMYNRKRYSDYTIELNKITSTATDALCNPLGMSLAKFLRYENRIFKKKALRKPQLEIQLLCKATYTSPKGRNHYWKEEVFSFEEIKSVFEQLFGNLCI